MSLHAHIQGKLLTQLQAASQIGPNELNEALRLLSKWRSVLIQNTVLQRQGTLVMQGPLKGLYFLEQSAEGCHVAKLLGCYEQPLQPYIQQAIDAGYPTILNIGCAEGYYAVGMARRMPDTTVFAYDLNEAALPVCRELAQRNGVADRVHVGGLFTPADFSAYADRPHRVLVLCDIEGAERDLLNPQAAPSLAGMDLIVESHECLLPGITAELVARFSPTHHVTVVQDDGQRQLESPPAWFCNLAHLDQLLATWEWRSGPTPWLVMLRHP